MTPSRKIIIPIPSHDFDPTEVAVTWKILRDAGHTIDFATPDGQRGYADPLMVSGQGLDPWGWVPGVKHLRLFGLVLRADRFGRRAYGELAQDARFLHPKRYDELAVNDYDALVLPGGHAQGMRPYLENPTLQSLVVGFRWRRCAMVCCWPRGPSRQAPASRCCTGGGLLGCGAGGKTRAGPGQRLSGCARHRPKPFFENQRRSP